MIVANLPYKISAPLVIKWLRAIGGLERLVIMVQKEVADRLAAPPGNKTYGRLSVITQWLCRVKIAFNVAPRAFTPPPKVVSSVVVLQPRPEPLAPARWQNLEAVTAAAFNQRRKMLRASLKAMDFDFEALKIPPTARAVHGCCGEMQRSQCRGEEGLVTKFVVELEQQQRIGRALAVEIS